MRALARPPIELRSVDIARCTQIARRRKLDMVAALAAATESPQVPPEARERIRVFLKLYRSAARSIDTMRPDLYVHRLIERLGLRRQQLFAAQADVVQRLRALARFGELASAYVGARAAGDAARVRALDRRGRRATACASTRSPSSTAPAPPSRCWRSPMRAGSRSTTSTSSACTPGCSAPRAGADPGRAAARAAARRRRGRPDGRALRSAAVRRAHARPPARRAQLRAHRRARRGDRARAAAERGADRGRGRLGGPRRGAVRPGRDAARRPTGCCATSCWRAPTRAGGRLGELRFDTDLDVSHAVVRYLELLKLAALIAAARGPGRCGALRDVNARILQAVTAEQREIFTSSPLDDYLLGAERDARRRAQAIAARDEPSLEPFLPRRGDGVILSASDIDTYRACPLKYKFARVFRIPQEPTLHQRFGILVHQVLERFHAGGEERAARAARRAAGAARRRAGAAAASATPRRSASCAGRRPRRSPATTSGRAPRTRRPVWFERQFTFKLGPHLLRGRVDRVDRLPSGEYELIDYKTGRPKTAEQLADDVQLSLYAVGAREAWGLEASRQAYYYVLDDEKVAVPGDEGDRAEWICAVANEVAERDHRPGVRADAVAAAPARSATTGSSVRPPSAERVGCCADCTAVGAGARVSRARRVVAALAQEALQVAGDRVAARERRPRDLLGRSAARSSRSTNAWTSGSLWTAALTWRS